MASVKVCAFVQIGGDDIAVSAFRQVPLRASQRVQRLSRRVLQDRMRTGLTQLICELVGDQELDGRNFERPGVGGLVADD